jgi:FtsP/CotA-like multicopper oxidase with cupredoxin domain
MSRTQRLVLVALAVLVAVAAIVIVSSSGGSDKVKSSGPATILVRNAKPVGGVRTLTYKKGDTVDLTVRSDTADEVHFHGYDLHRDVTKGGTVSFRFPASIEGKFIVELENAKQTLANVEVKP